MKLKSIIILALLSMILFFIGEYTDNYLLRLITKPLPIIGMLVLLKPANNYSKFIFGGLSLSVIGDVLLEYNASLFVYGLVAFLLAHIAYIIAFFKRSNKIALLPLIFLMIYGVVIYWMLYPGLGNMAHPVLLYLIVILIMCWRAFAQANFNTNAIFSVAGSVLFVISDSLFALNKFYVEIQYAVYLIMITYWSAQILIFYSAFTDEKELK